VTKNENDVYHVPSSLLLDVNFILFFYIAIHSIHKISFKHLGTTTHSFRLFFWRFCPLGRKTYWNSLMQEEFESQLNADEIQEIHF